MQFATINFCISGSNTSRCHHTCSVTDYMGIAIQKLITNKGHNTFVLDDGTILSNVVICSFTDTPVCTMNHHAFLTRLLGISL